MQASAPWWWAARGLPASEPVSDPSVDTLLEGPRRALECGEYGRCLQLLEPLAQAHGPSTRLGGTLRLLMATAQMGQGDSAAAAATCRSLRACRDATLRAQAKELQDVLEAPALERPREWSMTLPSLGEMQSLEGDFKAMARRRRRDKPAPPPPPPTGPTQAPWGFALVAVVLLALTALLGGCVQLETSLRFPAPGRLQLSQSSLSATSRPLPWQQQLGRSLRDSPFHIQQREGLQTLQAPVLPAPQALALLKRSVNTAANLAGLELPDPVLQLQERNWLLGVRQTLQLAIDLRPVQALPGLELAINLEPMGAAAVRQAEPLAVAPKGPTGQRRLRWVLQPGALNRLEASSWRWSRLGVGAVGIALLLALALMLQQLRIRLGFGLPQLPA
ncbi:DUF3153 domain-containing protein [Synechococcus sp. HJ21-Hayes]|jgi:hypothetical protein|nr:DUF3153 domain-containing protein [Synechococcus sp. JJ3a-Johnson]MCP9851817.1 DUF3153 domain-containing protein [Synechococcus sp. HJ21-Hayes]